LPPTEGLLRHAAQTQSHPLRTHLRNGQVVARLALVSLENVALWHERDISHSSAERVILPDGTLTLHYMLKTFNNVLKIWSFVPK